MRFRAVLQLGGKTATGIQVPDEVVASLGPGKRPAVRVTINGYTYPSTVAVMGGTFMLPVSAEVRAHAGVAAGDEVDVDLDLDTAPREVTVPADVTDALDRDPDAKGFFDGLSYSNKRASCSPSRTPRPLRRGSDASTKPSARCVRGACSASDARLASPDALCRCQPRAARHPRRHPADSW